MPKRYRVTFETEDSCAVFRGTWVYIPEGAKITEIEPPFEPGYFRSTVTKRVYYVAEIVDKTHADYQLYDVVGTELRQEHRLRAASLQKHYERIDHLA